MIRQFLLPTAALTTLLWHSSLCAAQLFGPSAYLSSADIPAGFYNDTFTELEDFEDDSLTANILAGPAVRVLDDDDLKGSVDSVDADDGVIDGSGLTGRSLFCSCGLQGITLTFPENTTSAGFVWTDGLGTVTFEAFGPGGLLGSITEADFVDASLAGTTAEDRFFGARDAGGITSLRISNTMGGIEIDHIQYEVTPPVIPEPTSALLSGMGLCGMLLMRSRRKANQALLERVAQTPQRCPASRRCEADVC